MVIQDIEVIQGSFKNTKCLNLLIHSCRMNNNGILKNRKDGL